MTLSIAISTFRVLHDFVLTGSHCSLQVSQWEPRWDLSCLVTCGLTHFFGETCDWKKFQKFFKSPYIYSATAIILVVSLIAYI